MSGAAAPKVPDSPQAARGKPASLDGFAAAARRGLTSAIPFLLIGSVCLILESLPIPGYQSFMVGLFGPFWQQPLKRVFEATIGALSLYIVFGVAYSYASERRERIRGAPDPLLSALVSVCCFMAVTGFGAPGFSPADLGATGMFTALLVAAASPRLFALLHRVDAFRTRAYGDGAHDSFNDAVAAVFPAFITVGAFAAANAGLRVFLPGGLQDAITRGFLAAEGGTGESLPGALLFMFLVHALWALGLHGSNVLEPVARLLYVPADSANSLLAAGGFPPNFIFTKTFFDIFVFMGGCGCMLGLAIAVFAAGKRANLRRHAFLSSFPLLFNVSELWVFGLPIVLNPVYVVPFVLTPLLLTAVSWAAMRTGLVPMVSAGVEWTSPVLLGGWAAVGSWRGAALQAVNLAVAVACYLPFVRLAERMAEVRVRRAMAGLLDVVEAAPARPRGAVLLHRRDQTGRTCRILAADLEDALAAGSLDLAYQPQVDYGDRLVGAEALLRWKHPLYGPVPPPVAIAVASDAGLEDALGGFVIDRACRDLASLNLPGTHGDLRISVNVSARQLEGDALIRDLSASLGRHAVDPRLLKIEITEKDALAGTRRTLELLKSVRGLGVTLAMDDFGMGHSSLLYLKEYEFETVKVDGSLVRELETNPSCGEIISSIVYLGKSLTFSVMAEFVETPGQRELLHRLGCDLYQGYLYAPALPIGGFAGLLAGSAGGPALLRPKSGAAPEPTPPSSPPPR